MKYIITTLFLCSTLATFGQSDTTELTKEKIYEDVKGAITQLSSALEVGAEHVYSILVKQQVVTAWVWITVDLFWLFTTVFLFVLTLKVGQPVKYNFDYAPFGPILCCLICSGIITILTIIFTVNTIITGFLNPEYGAITEILDLLK